MLIPEFFVVRKAKRALLKAKHHVGLLGVMVLIDVLGVFFVGFFGSEIVARIYNEMDVLLEMMTKAGIGMDFLFNAASTYLEPGQVLFFRHRQSLFMYFFVLIVLVYLFYCVFQGINWYLTKRIDDESLRFWPYYVRFFGINLVWFSLLSLILVIAVKLSYLRAYVVTPKLIQFFVMVFAFLFAVIITYLAPISYSLLMHKNFMRKAFVQPFGKISVFFPMYVLLVVLFVVCNFILTIAGFANVVVWFIAGLVFFMPLISFSRIYINLVAESVIK